MFLCIQCCTALIDALLYSLYEAFQRREDMPRTLHDLASAHPVPDAVLSVLHDACNQWGNDEEKFIAAFLSWLGANTDTSRLSPDFIAMLRGKVAGLRGFRALRQFMKPAVERPEPGSLCHERRCDQVRV